MQCMMIHRDPRPRTCKLGVGCDVEGSAKLSLMSSNAGNSHACILPLWITDAETLVVPAATYGAANSEMPSFDEVPLVMFLYRFASAFRDSLTLLATSTFMFDDLRFLPRPVTHFGNVQFPAPFPPTGTHFGTFHLECLTTII